MRRLFSLSTKPLATQTLTTAQKAWSLANGWLLTLLTATALWPVDSSASSVVAATSIGDVICNFQTNAGVFPYIVVVVCYISGIYLIVNGVLTLRKHVEAGGQQSHIVPGLVKLAVGGVLTCLPTLAMILQISFVGGLSSSSDFGCEANTVTATTSTSSLDVILNNFVDNIHQPMFYFLAALSVFVGLNYIARGLFKAAKTGTDPRAAAPHVIIAYLFLGSILITGGGMLWRTTYSIFGTDTINSMKSFSGINWSRLGASGDFTGADSAVQAVLAFIQIIGAIAFLRGWMILKGAVEGSSQDTIPKGITHIIGGVLAINIDRTLKIIDNTFGTGMIN
jgi:hypothetical protein